MSDGQAGKLLFYELIVEPVKPRQNISEMKNQVDYTALSQYNLLNIAKGGEIFEKRNSTDIRSDSETAIAVIEPVCYPVHQRAVRRESSLGQHGRVPEHRVRFAQAPAANVRHGRYNRRKPCLSLGGGNQGR